MTTKTLKPKRQKFVNGVASHGNGAQAAREAGYSEHTARTTASELMTNPDVQAAVAEKQAEYAAEAAITFGEIANGLRREANAGDKSSPHPVRVSALMGLGKLGGLIVEKSEARTVNVDVELTAHSLEDLRAMVEAMKGGNSQSQTPHLPSPDAHTALPGPSEVVGDE